MESEVKRTERGDKIKLEDMTLKQIKNLKADIKNAMMDGLWKSIEPYDLGLDDVLVSVDPQVEQVPLCFETDGRYLSANKSDLKRIVIHKFEIKFSKEDD